jgi:hypothetical protein
MASNSPRYLTWEGLVPCDSNVNITVSGSALWLQDVVFHVVVMRHITGPDSALWANVIGSGFSLGAYEYHMISFSSMGYSSGSGSQLRTHENSFEYGSVRLNSDILYQI